MWSGLSVTGTVAYPRMGSKGWGSLLVQLPCTEYMDSGFLWRGPLEDYAQAFDSSFSVPNIAHVILVRRPYFFFFFFFCKVGKYGGYCYIRRNLGR
jgi:hypothetical protein